jgi:hypothetical protein
MSRVRDFAGAVLVVILSPFLFLLGFFRMRDRREYGLTPKDRAYEIRRKFGEARLSDAKAVLDGVSNPDDRVLGAIVFLAVSFDQLADLVTLANTDRERVLNAATVKDERG